MYLSSAAASGFFHTTRISFIFGIIGYEHFIERINILFEMSKPGTPINIHARAILHAEDFHHGELPRHTDELNFSSVTCEIEFGPSDDDLSVQFKGMLGNRKWKFIISDPDPQPSVPHGHQLDDDRIKLDPYLGWVYKRTTQIERVGRREIILLWNEDSFRDWALRCIHAFLDARPDYIWRVANPLKLPSRRMPRRGS